jgi:hypothetical protein
MKTMKTETVRKPYEEELIQRPVAPPGTRWVTCSYQGKFILTNEYNPNKPTLYLLKGRTTVNVKFLGQDYSCHFACENTEEYGHWVVLTRRGSKPIDVMGEQARPILDYIHRALQGTTNFKGDMR